MGMFEFFLLLVAADFAKDVHPVLAARCLPCHSAQQRMAGFSVATYGDVLKGGKSGRAIEPGSGASSLLVRRIAAEGVPVMPPAGPRLTQNQAAAIREWIDDGARKKPGGERARGAWVPVMSLSKPALASADAIIEAYWSAQGVLPARPVSDSVYARRAFLDIWGLLPTPAQLTTFEQSKDPNKHATLIRLLLRHSRNYAEHWITFWNDHLRNDEGVNYEGTRTSITDWLRHALETNTPYDQFTRELLNPAAESGSEGFLLGVNWRGDVSASQTPPMQAAQNASQVFLGVNLKCNACHDSFINRWKLADAYGLASFFAEDKLELVRCDAKTGKWSRPAFLYPELGGVAENAGLATKREAAARLFTARANGRFARTIVNRIWKRLMGRGIVEPADDMDAEPWSPELLDWLAADFVEHGYDLKHLIGRIALTRAYALPAAPTTGQYIFRGPSPRRMTAEQFLDAVSSITGEWRPRLTPKATMAEQSREWRLPSSPVSRALGRPIRDQVFTERAQEATTSQALELVNGEAFAKFLGRASLQMLGELPPAPRNLFDSGLVSYGRVDVDIDITGLQEIRLLVIDPGSHAPGRVLPVWGEARWIDAGGEEHRLSPGAAKVRLKGWTYAHGVRTGHLGNGPVEKVYDLRGKNLRRFRATVGLEESCLLMEVGPAARFFVFAEKPDPERLVQLDPQVPLNPPRGPWTVDSLTNRIFRHALGRAPVAVERRSAAALLTPAGNGKISATGLADLLWCVAALPEFRLL